ncbi:MAG: pyrrolysine--tRNA(Pyl) ligase large subunit [Firmicutes bacterium]|nr:pyrrolysine--tRNA(Pyl) ligase large subunit [Bacillota bacterium]
MKYSNVQRQRLIELGQEENLELEFASDKQRDDSFRELARSLEKKNKAALDRLQKDLRPETKVLEEKLLHTLLAEGYVEVSTPIIMSKGLLQKMGLPPDHPLWRQVFWVGSNKLLRPMLAPHLYYLLRYFQKLWSSPVRIFEVGPVFRKESKGQGHVEEFTMLNLVSLGCDSPDEQLQLMVDKLIGQFGRAYSLVSEPSEVYGETTDVVIREIEVASAAIGPHILDANWEISGAWFGMGIGLERLAMALNDHPNIRRVSRSLSYQNAARLNV